jgi:transcription antitermination factor NusG
MPLLKKEKDIFPDHLFETIESMPSENGQGWWAMQTLPRCEKKLMRQLITDQIPFYAPVVEKRYRSPQGRARTVFAPLFSNYVFLFGDRNTRYSAISTGSVCRVLEVSDNVQFVEDISRIYRAIQTGEPVFPEAKLEPGDPVRVKNGPFKGFEGVVIRRENQLRLLISVRCMGQGISVQLMDCQIEAI